MWRYTNSIINNISSKTDKCDEKTSCSYVVQLCTDERLEWIEVFWWSGRVLRQL